MKTLLSKFNRVNKSLLIKYIVSLVIISSQLSCKPVRDNNKLIVASAGKIESLDPAQANTLRSLQLISALGDTLFRLDTNGELQPILAKSLPRISNDRLTIDIPLRKGVLFHDETPFDAIAMAFSLNRFIRIGTLNYVIGERIEEVIALDRFTLRLKLQRPSSSINGLLTSINLTPISPKAYSDYKDKFLNDYFVGTGPYKLTNFENEKQKLEPFDKYWGEKPHNSGIDYINFTNSTALFGAIKTGEVDVLLSNSIDDGQRLALNKMSQNGKLNEGIGPSMQMGYITFRSNSKPLNNPNIRKALSYSINRELITQKVSYGMRKPLRSLIPPILTNNSESPWPQYNPNTARSLLKSEGYCQGNQLVLPLTFRSNVPADKLLALTWQEQIKKDLGDCLKLNLNGVESTTVYKQLAEGAYPAVILDWKGDYPDPEAYLSPLLSCRKINNDICQEGEAVFSGSFWASSEVQAALLKSEELMGTERIKKLEEVNKYAAKGSAYLPIWLDVPKAWSQNTIKKPEFDGSGFLLLNRLGRREE